MSIRLRAFTTVELVVVLVVLGVLAAIAVPRLVGRTAFEARGFHDQTAAALRYAQRTAVAARRPVFVAFSPVAGACAVTACYDSACSAPLLAPAGGGALCVRAPSAVTFTASVAAIAFDSLGRPDQPVSLTIGSAGEPDRTITVVAATGHVRTQ